MRLRAGSVLAPLGLRPRHLVALTVLRGRDGITQQALSITLEMDGTNIPSEVRGNTGHPNRRGVSILSATWRYLPSWLTAAPSVAEARRDARQAPGLATC